MLLVLGLSDDAIPVRLVQQLGGSPELQARQLPLELAPYLRRNELPVIRPDDDVATFSMLASCDFEQGAFACIFCKPLELLRIGSIPQLLLCFGCVLSSDIATGEIIKEVPFKRTFFNFDFD